MPIVWLTGSYQLGDAAKGSGVRHAAAARETSPRRQAAVLGSSGFATEGDQPAINASTARRLKVFVIRCMTNAGQMLLVLLVTYAKERLATNSTGSSHS